MWVIHQIANLVDSMINQFYKISQHEAFLLVIIQLLINLASYVIVSLIKWRCLHISPDIPFLFHNSGKQYKFASRIIGNLKSLRFVLVLKINSEFRDRILYRSVMKYPGKWRAVSSARVKSMFLSMEPMKSWYAYPSSDPLAALFSSPLWSCSGLFLSRHLHSVEIQWELIEI